MDVSLEGTRQRAMQWWPAARVCLSAERPTPVLAPKNATVFVLELLVIVLVFDVDFEFKMGEAGLIIQPFRGRGS